MDFFWTPKPCALLGDPIPDFWLEVAWREPNWRDLRGEARSYVIE